MFNTILTTIQPGGNTIQRVYEGKTEKLSVYFALNLWSTYDKVPGEEIHSLETTDKDINGRSLYMIDNRNVCTMNPRDIARHSQNDRRVTFWITVDRVYIGLLLRHSTVFSGVPQTLAEGRSALQIGNHTTEIQGSIFGKVDSDITGYQYITSL